MSLFQPLGRIGFQTKVLAPVVVVLVLVVAGTLWVVNRIVRVELRREAARDLATADSVFRNSQEIRVKNLLLRFRAVSHEPRFKAVAQLGDPATFEVFLAELVAELGVDVALFTAADGRVLATAARSPAFDHREFAAATATALTQVGATSQPAIDLVTVGGRIFDTVALPTVVMGHFVGVLRLGVELGPPVAQELKQLAHQEIVFLDRDRVLLSTLAVDFPPTTELTGRFVRAPGSAHSPPDSIQEIVLEGEHFFGTSGDLVSLDGETRLHYVLLSSCESHFQLLRLAQQRIGLIGFAGVLLGTTIVWLVVRGATGPLRHLRDAAEQLGRGNFQSSVRVDSRDECGELAHVFNQMVDNLGASRRLLQQAHDELDQRVQERTQALQDEIGRRELAQREAQAAHDGLMIASRQAGMAEVATGALHNVGNVLNSVNVSSNLIREGLSVSHPRFQLLHRTTALLREQTDLPRFLADDPRGQLVPPLLIELTAQLALHHQNLLGEVDQLSGNIDHIKQIIAAQQDYAQIGGVIQSLDPADLFAESLRLVDTSLKRSEISVRPLYPARSPAPIQTDRHQVVQILVNFLANAIQAVTVRPVGERLIRLTLDHADNRWRFTVEDNGVGISPENLLKIFQHGFTTRRDGHGFGLHSGALCARRLGGQIFTHSDGPDRGARFTLELPTVPPTAPAVTG